MMNRYKLEPIEYDETYGELKINEEFINEAITALHNNIDKMLWGSLTNEQLEFVLLNVLETLHERHT